MSAELTDGVRRQAAAFLRNNHYMKHRVTKWLHLGGKLLRVVFVRAMLCPSLKCALHFVSAS